MDNLIYTGKVGFGLQNGTHWGFPTANISDVTPRFTLENGVYAVHVIINGKRWNAMMYIGTRPTLKLTKPTVEIHIFDFAQNIYNQSIQFHVLQKIRDEQTFNSIDSLIGQLKKDEEITRSFFRSKHI